jgi:hypothetical protein
MFPPLPAPPAAGGRQATALNIAAPGQGAKARLRPQISMDFMLLAYFLRNQYKNWNLLN